MSVMSFRGVRRAYEPGKNVLDGVDLDLGRGEFLALVGASGSGKSTLAKLMARLYDPTEGTIVFGGVDLRDATLASLRHRVVVVPQEQDGRKAGYVLRIEVLGGAPDDDAARGQE